jgi:hypothetical protein
MSDVREEPGGEERRNAHDAIERMILLKLWQQALQREGEVIRKVLFLIGNRHFLIRKCHFGIGEGPYVERGPSATTLSSLIRSLP